MPTSIDPSTARLWRTSCDDSLAEPAWAERLLERASTDFAAARALFLVGPPASFACQSRWPVDAQTFPAELVAALVREARQRLAGSERTFGWPSSAAEGQQVLACALTVEGHSDGALVLLRAEAWSPAESAFLKELAGAVSDARSRRQALAALRQSETRYRIVAELGTRYAFSVALRPDGTAATDWITGVRNAGKGEPFDDPAALGAALGDQSPEARALVVRLVAQCSKDRQRARGDFQLKDRRMRLDCMPVWSAAEGRVDRVYGIVRDVTDEAQERAALEHDRDLWGALVEACPVGLVHVSPEGVVLDCNEAAAALLAGGSKEDLLGRPTTDFSPRGEASRGAGALAQLRSGRLPTALRWAGRSADGREVVCDVFLKPLHLGDGPTAGFLAMVREAAGSPVAGLAAQLGDLLSAILGNSGLALSALSTDSPARADLIQAINAAESAAKLLRPKAPSPRREGRQRPRVVVIEPEELVRRVASTILEREGFEVMPLAAASDVDRALRDGVSDLVCVVLDVREPSEEAAVAIRELRAVRPGLPLVLTSALERHEVGADDTDAVHLPKPYSRDQLVAALSRAVSKAHPRA